MADDLTELRERIQFARSEIPALESAVGEFLHASVKLERRPNGSHIEARPQYDMFVTFTKAVPTSIPAKAGMIVNELRASLDGLACQLAIRNGRSPSEVYFPISKSKTIFEEDGRRKMRKLSASDQAIIEGLTPYRGGNELLFGLHEADRTRKHHRLVVVSNQHDRTIAGAGGVLDLGRVGGLVIENLTVNGSTIAGLEYFGTPENLDVGQEFCIASGMSKDMPFSLKCNVSYREPEELRGKSVTLTLWAFAEAVSDVLSLFE